MQVPLELSFRNLEHAPEIEASIREKVDKLEEFYDRITGCRVVVELPRLHQKKGKIYQVRIYLSVPNQEIVVDHDPGEHHAHEDVHVAIRDAFNAVRRQLQDYVRKLDGRTKTHETPPHGTIKQIFPSSIDVEDGYGFITAPDGRDIYFDARSLLDAQLTDLAAGMEVRYVEEEGDKGPQATSVRLVGRHHHLAE